MEREIILLQYCKTNGYSKYDSRKPSQLNLCADPSCGNCTRVRDALKNALENIPDIECGETHDYTISSIDKRIEELIKIRGKAYESSPTSKAIWALGLGKLHNSSSGGIFWSGPHFDISIKAREDWEDSKDGRLYQSAQRDITKLQNYKEMLLKGEVDNLKEKLNLEL